LANQIEIKDQGLDDLRTQIIKSIDLNNEMMLRSILNRQLSNRQEDYCLSCDSEGDCFILNGIIYLRLKKHEKAIEEFQNANWHLRSKNETWKSIIGMTLLGLALEENGKMHLALHEYKKAYETLAANLWRINTHDQLMKANEIKNELLEKLKELAVPYPSTAPSSNTAPHKTNATNSSIDKRDYLTLFSIPIYGTVEAGLNGQLHIDHFGMFTIVNQVEINKKAFDIYNVHGVVDPDRQITIKTNREYGWLRVQGLSMNGWDLPFNENDFVLFYRAPNALHQDFVIASNMDSSGEISLMVKRFDAARNQLLSRSTDTRKSYDPIPVDEQHQILGIVIAMAKPTT